MEELIRQSFLHVEGFGSHVAEGHYDLIGPNGEVILPRVWGLTIEPGWMISMHMWPMPESPKPELLPSSWPEHNFTGSNERPQSRHGDHSARDLPARSLPTIFVNETPVNGVKHRREGLESIEESIYPASVPLTIPHHLRGSVPPPLPPPRYLADIDAVGNNGPDITWQWGNSDEKNSDWGSSIASVQPGSSLYSGSH
jgi:hypothetical protein